MKVQYEVTPEENPNVVGEYLRDQFFNQSKGKRGCYSTFESNENVVELDKESIDEDYDNLNIYYHVFSKEIDNEKIIMKYYWDGDGTLEFHFEDGTQIFNNDCKKDYCWEFLDSEGNWR